MKTNYYNALLLVLALLPFSSHAGNFDTKLSGAIGYDSNAYRAPSDSYIDFFEDTAGNVTVDPDVQSGFYLPLSLDLDYDKKLTEKWLLVGAYKFDGDFYLDDKLSNADRTRHRGTLGGKYRILNFKRRKSAFYTGIILGDRNRTYYDRDTGLEKTSSATSDDVSDLYSYSTRGYEFAYDYWKKKQWDFSLKYRVEERDHDSVPVGSEYDNQYDRLDSSFDYRFNSSFRIGLDYSIYSYDYDFRHARNLSGQLFASNPLLKYDYTRTGIVLKHRLNKKLSLKYGYKVTHREDNYLGYNDYDKDEISLVLRYHPNDKYLFRAKLSSSDREYPDAWNFDRDPALYPAITDTEHKSDDSTSLKLSADYRMDQKTTLFGDLAVERNENSDPRYNYDRDRIVVGVKWALD